MDAAATMALFDAVLMVPAPMRRVAIESNKPLPGVDAQVK
jgi:hypothetical protein